MRWIHLIIALLSLNASQGAVGSPGTADVTRRADGKIIKVVYKFPNSDVAVLEEGGRRIGYLGQFPAGGSIMEMRLENGILRATLQGRIECPPFSPAASAFTTDPSRTKCAFVTDPKTGKVYLDGSVEAVYSGQQAPDDPYRGFILLHNSTNAAPQIDHAKPPDGWPRITLTGIMVSGGKRQALINGRRLTVGQDIDGGKIESISRDEVRVTYQGETRRFSLGQTSSAAK